MLNLQSKLYINESKSMKDLFVISKECGIKQRHGLNKQELLKAINEEIMKHNQEVEQQYMEWKAAQSLQPPVKQEEKPVRKPRKPLERVKRPIVLINDKDEVIEKFENQAKAIHYCVTNGVCNVGWANCSLKTGKAMYIKDNGKITKSQNGKYHGVGYRLLFVI